MSSPQKTNSNATHPSAGQLVFEINFLKSREILGNQVSKDLFIPQMLTFEAHLVERSIWQLEDFLENVYYFPSLNTYF